jgi:hypothetical protein
MSVIGIVKKKDDPDGITDLSINHDKYLNEGDKPSW